MTEVYQVWCKVVDMIPRNHLNFVKFLSLPLSPDWDYVIESWCKMAEQ